MSTLISSRARLVDLLWQLKQAYDHNNERGYDAHDVRFIHFNMLLNDEEYRNEVIARAALSKDKKQNSSACNFRSSTPMANYCISALQAQPLLNQ